MWITLESVSSVLACYFQNLNANGTLILLIWIWNCILKIFVLIIFLFSFFLNFFPFFFVFIFHAMVRGVLLLVLNDTSGHS